MAAFGIVVILVERLKLGRKAVRFKSGPLWNGRAALTSDFSLLSEKKRIFNINPKISDSVFNLGVPKQDLNSAEIARGLINH